MKEVILFGKEGCALCEGWKRKLTHLSIPFAYYDIGTTDGLVEMAYHNVGRIPALLIGEKRFEEVNPSEVTSKELLVLAEPGPDRQELFDG
ncbi:MAG: glutaredoxin family protein [Candidatus Omnitrophota bacterium]